MAHAGSGDAYSNLTCTRRGEVDVDELDRGLRIAEDNSFHDILRVEGAADDARRVRDRRHPTNMWIAEHVFTLCMIRRWLVMSPPWRDTSKGSCCTGAFRVRDM